MFESAFLFSRKSEEIMQYTQRAKQNPGDESERFIELHKNKLGTSEVPNFALFCAC